MASLGWQIKTENCSLYAANRMYR